MIKKALQWHPAFQAILQIELLEDSDCLEFLKEFQLSDKPLQMDTLIVKRTSGAAIKKSIGQIFKMYNIIEYKSPKDYLSINDFYKVIGYACIYQSDTEHIAQIPPEELTITLVSSRYPRDLIRHLANRYGTEVEEIHAGIYYISKLMFPLQLVIAGKLPEDEYVWLSRLRKNLTVAMDFIIRANQKQYKEGRNMCDALRELFQSELIEREALGIGQGIKQGMGQGMEKGKADGILELLADLGTIPESLCNIVMAQHDLKLLTAWLKIAARATTIEDFMQKIG